MSLVNVRVKNIRPEYHNLKEWCEDSNNVYIGRGRIVIIDGVRYPPESSLFCNPYKLQDCSSIEECLELYEHHLRKLLKDSDMRKEFLKLKGKNLGCWCVPNLCHGDIILKYLNKM